MKILKIIIITISFTTTIGLAKAQYNQQKNFVLLNHYTARGHIYISHESDGSMNAYKSIKLSLHAPFYLNEKQLFALETEIKKENLLGDQKLEALMALGWTMEIIPQWKISASAGTIFQRNEVNRQSESFNQADPLVSYQQFNNAGVTASIGVLQKYFWLIGGYNQIFALNSEYNAYKMQYMNATLGAQYQLNDWEIKLPIQAFDLIHFDKNNVYAGIYIAYKNNYIYAQSNIKSRMAFEMGFKPYTWLSLGFIYELNPANNIPGYGIYSAYLWKSQKLAL